jgi:hypothetical protein
MKCDKKNASYHWLQLIPGEVSVPRPLPPGLTGWYKTHKIYLDKK